MSEIFWAYEIESDWKINLRRTADEIADGGVIREGFNADLDELRKLSRSAKQTIASFEEYERKAQGIFNLKIKFNGVRHFMKYPKATRQSAWDYETSSNLTNAERFTTPQLKEWEQKVLGADEASKKLNLKFFKKFAVEVTKETQKLQSTARALAKFRRSGKFGGNFSQA